MHITEKMKDGLVLASIAAFAGGSVPVAAKIALEVFHPFTVVSLRFLFATIFLLPFVYKKKELNKHFFQQLVGVAVIGSLNPILLFLALPFTTASVSPLIYAAVPTLTAIYLYLTQKQFISKRQTVGIVLGFSGVAQIILLPILQKHQNISAFYGNILILGAAIAFMLYGVWSKKKQQQLLVSPLALTFYFSLVTLLISVPFTGHELFLYGVSAEISFRHMLSAVFVGIVGTGLFYIVYQYALKIGSEFVASLFTYLQPIATVLLAAVFLGEKITFVFIIGGVLAILGARLASKK